MRRMTLVQPWRHRGRDDAPEVGEREDGPPDARDRHKDRRVPSLIGVEQQRLEEATTAPAAAAISADGE